MLKHYFGIFWERIKQIIHTHRNLQILPSKIIQNEQLSKWIIYIIYHDLIINSGDVCREVSWSCLWHVRTLVIWKWLILSTQKRNKIVNWPKNVVFPIDIWADFGTRQNLWFGNKKLRPRETTRPIALKIRRPDPGTLRDFPLDDPFWGGMTRMTWWIWGSQVWDSLDLWSSMDPWLIFRCKMWPISLDSLEKLLRWACESVIATSKLGTNMFDHVRKFTFNIFNHPTPHPHIIPFVKKIWGRPKSNRLPSCSNQNCTFEYVWGISQFLLNTSILGWSEQNSVTITKLWPFQSECMDMRVSAFTPDKNCAKNPQQNCFHLPQSASYSCKCTSTASMLLMLISCPQLWCQTLGYRTG